MIPQICIGNSTSYIGQIQHLVEVNVPAGVVNYIILWLAKIAFDHSQECLQHHISERKASFNKTKLSVKQEHKVFYTSQEFPKYSSDPQDFKGFFKDSLDY